MTESPANQFHEPDPTLDAPEPLVAGLRSLAQRAPAIPADMDEAIAAAAATHLRSARQPGAGRRWGLAIAAAVAIAAGVALPIVMTSTRTSPSGTGDLAVRPIGRADILPAFELARRLEGGKKPDARWDANGDGRVDMSDVQTLAQRAVEVPVPVPLPEGMEQAPLARGPAGAAAAPTRFIHVDLVIDPHGQKLAAYQVDLTLKDAHTSIVGIESGQGDAFGQAPPYYDRKAVEAGRPDRLTIAMFSTLPAAKLPAGPVRVATLHLMVEGNARPGILATLRTAADPQGQQFDAKVTVTQENNP